MFVNQVNVSGRAANMQQVKSGFLLELTVEKDFTVKIMIAPEQYPKKKPIRKGDPVFVTGALIKGRECIGIKAAKLVNMRPGYEGTVDITEAFEK